ncbi:XRE family transcriptional regulator [Streptomyces sp. 8N706]|uniref:XRE family transcriptional regulator n=1 Tax=Streptomyces sp. 8N706 TaxID=3457416 RepID=UPI003FD38E11
MHAHRGGQHTGPGVGDADRFQQSLDLSVLSPQAVQAQQRVRVGLDNSARPADCPGSGNQIPAAQAWNTMWELRRLTAVFRAGRRTLVQDRELVRTGGMLSVVLAWLAHDLGDTDAAQAFATDARHHDLAAESGILCAWADDVAATVHLYGDRPKHAAECAARGLAAAPPGTAAHVRLAAQSARAHARAGHSDQFADNRRLAEQLAGALPLHASGLFSADQVRVLSFEATSYLALSRPRQALTAAEQAVAQYRRGPHLSPTRAVIAHLDLAAAHASLGDYEAAIEAGTRALDAPRPADAITRRARDLASSLNSTTAPSSARDFAARLTT